MNNLEIRECTNSYEHIINEEINFIIETLKKNEELKNKAWNVAKDLTKSYGTVEYWDRDDFLSTRSICASLLGIKFDKYLFDNGEGILKFEEIKTWSVELHKFNNEVKYPVFKCNKTKFNSWEEARKCYEELKSFIYLLNYISNYPYKIRKRIAYNEYYNSLAKKYCRVGVIENNKIKLDTNIFNYGNVDIGMLKDNNNEIYYIKAHIGYMYTCSKRNDVTIECTPKEINLIYKNEECSIYNLTNKNRHNNTIVSCELIIMKNGRMDLCYNGIIHTLRESSDDFYPQI